MPTITPCLWFDHNAEEAVNFYTAIFKHSKIGRVARYGEDAAKVSGRPAGTVMTIEFELDGKGFVALNGGPVFTFNEAISFQVQCKTQEEVDHYWEHLSKGGDVHAQQCGWLKDKYGVSWQIVPTGLVEMLQDKDSGKTNRVMNALLQMKKIDVKGLEQAYGGQ